MVQVSGTAAIVFGTNRAHSRDKIKAACDAQGWTKMVNRPPSKNSALNSAISEVARPLLPDVDGPVSIRALEQELAFEAIKVVRGGTMNDDAFICSCQLARDGAHEVQLLQSHKDLDPTDLQNRLQAAYDTYRDMLSASQVRTVVAAVVRQVQGVSLGGVNVYYVPHEGVQAWRTWRDAAGLWAYHESPLEVASSPETVQHIISQLNVEVSEQSQEVLAAINAGDLAPKSAKALAKRSRALVEKIKAYEAALGQQLDWMRGPLENAQAALGVASLMAVST